MLVGSSNLSQAAFEANYEANVAVEIDAKTYLRAQEWIDDIIAESRRLDADWIKGYTEAKRYGRGKGGNSKKGAPPRVLDVPAEEREGFGQQLVLRRATVKSFNGVRRRFIGLLQQGAAHRLTNEETRDGLLRLWNNGRRFQGKSWERRGMNSDFRRLASGVLTVLNAANSERDDVVAATIDGFRKPPLPTRKAVFSEWLCLLFPGLYPVHNKPVDDWLADERYRAPRGASEGVRYIDIARAMRATLRQSNYRFDNFRIRNLAEFDLLLWQIYGNR